VGRIEGVGDLDRQVQNLFNPRTLLGQEMLEGFTLEQLHGDEVSPFVLVDIVNGADVGVI